MSDVLFRYLLSAREHDGSFRQRALLTDERLLAAAIEKILETAALRVEFSSQHERTAVVQTSVPASKWDQVTFVDKITPNPPKAPHFEDRTDRFPNRATFQIQVCHGCSGKGQSACKHCQGRGVPLCANCAGRGYHTNIELQRVPCTDCGGKGELPCKQCDKTGVVKHDQCGGEGKVATWQEEIHVYSVNRERETYLPDGVPPEAAGLVDAWFERHPPEGKGPAVTIEAIGAELGYSTPELSKVILHAQMRRSSFEHQARYWPDRCLFTDATCHFVPISACLLGSEGSAKQRRYWLIGRGADAAEIRPDGLVDQWKIAGYVGGAIGIISGIASLVSFHARSLAQDPGSIVVPAVLTVLSILGLAAAGVGISRVILANLKTVHTIAILPCGGNPTPLLACIAALGSYNRRLRVLDRAWRTSLHTILGEEKPSACSRTVALHTSDGKDVRLIEIARPDLLVPDEWKRLLLAVKGIVFLPEKNAPADALRSRLHAATISRPTELSLPVDLVSVDCDRQGLATNGDVALDGIRRAFIRAGHFQLDWGGIFENLWGPFSLILMEKEEKDESRPTAAPSPARAVARSR